MTLKCKEIDSFQAVLSGKCPYMQFNVFYDLYLCVFLWMFTSNMILRSRLLPVLAAQGELS